MRLLGNGNVFGKRKFVIALLALLLSAVLVFVGRVSGDHWPTTVGLIVGLYGAASVGNQFARNNGPDTNP